MIEKVKYFYNYYSDGIAYILIGLTVIVTLVIPICLISYASTLEDLQCVKYLCIYGFQFASYFVCG